MLFDADKAIKMLAGPCLDEIEFSLDGSSAKESQLIRKGSSTEKIVQNIKYLIEQKNKMLQKWPKISIATTQFVVNDVTFPLPTPTCPQWLIETFGQDVNIKPCFAIKWPNMITQKNINGAPYFFELVDPIPSNQGYCDHVVNTLTVRSNGDVVPCCYDLNSEVVLGNVLSASLIDIWNSEVFIKFRTLIFTKRYPSLCSSCAVVRPPVYLIPNWDLINA